MSNHLAASRLKTLAAGCILLLALACSKPEENETEPVVPVRTAQVHRSPIQRIVTAQAILHPGNQAAIVPKISAPVRRFLVNRGDHVRRGQVLAELENRDLAAAALEARGNLDQAEANLRSVASASLPDELTKSQNEVQADKEALDAALKVYESRKLLLDQGALPRKQLDEAQVAYVQARSQYDSALKHLESLQRVGKEEQIKAAQAQVEAARGRRQASEVQIDYSRITSPIDGVVTDRPLYAGEMAASGAPLITVMDTSRIVARASVPVADLRFCKVGDPATVTSGDAGSELQGKVTVVSPALDPNSTTAEVWVLASNPSESLRPGATVRVAIVAETVPDALVIPASALLSSAEGSGENVIVVGSDSLAHQRQVEIGIRRPDIVQVVQGLKEGEQVVTVGGLGIPDKTKVTVETGSASKSDLKDEPKSEK